MAFLWQRIALGLRGIDGPVEKEYAFFFFSCIGNPPAHATPTNTHGIAGTSKLPLKSKLPERAK
jgi:hypothetical protein